MMAWDMMVAHLHGHTAAALAVVSLTMDPMVVRVVVHKEGQVG